MARFEEALETIGKNLDECGVWCNDHFTFSRKGWVLEVRELITKNLVAYSEMEADFKQSLEEFVWDYGGRQ